MELWQEVRRELIAFGCRSGREIRRALAQARTNGVSPGHCLELVRWAASPDQRINGVSPWGPGAVLNRIETAQPRVPVREGWLESLTAFESARKRQREAKDRTQMVAADRAQQAASVAIRQTRHERETRCGALLDALSERELAELLEEASVSEHERVLFRRHSRRFIPTRDRLLAVLDQRSAAEVPS